MTVKGVRIGLATSIAAIIALLVMPIGATAADSNDLHRAREGTAAFHSVAKASAAGYELFKDAKGIACIDKPGVGGMGIHYVNGSLIGHMVVDAARPEALVYEPEEDGKLRLVALEYIVFAAPWKNAGHTTPPTLFGHRFELVPKGNRYGLDPFYELHAWVWKHNPRGMFDDWNPKVSCSEDD